MKSIKEKSTSFLLLLKWDGRLLATCIFAIAVFMGMLLMPRPGVSKNKEIKSPFEWAMNDLDYLRDEKVQQLKILLAKTEGLARKVAQDDTVSTFFQINEKYSAGKKTGNVPSDLKKNIHILRQTFNSYYIINYLSFYDMLFIDQQGNVFYTIRNESDSHGHLLGGTDAKTPLGMCLATRPTKSTFVDFHYYSPSSEPAAFFVEPVLSDGVVVGWIALQWAINKVNAIFAPKATAAETEEVLLVNNDGYMLSESFFQGDSTILKKRLSKTNIRAKFQEGHGHRSVTDYRGVKALTSFKVVDFGEVRWLVVAKVDESEILTKEYILHRRFYASSILKLLQFQACPSFSDVKTENRLGVRVDMDEFSRAVCGEYLQTWGISTCTGLLAAYPGRFGYLAHISNKDVLLGGTETRLLEQITRKVKRFEVVPSERHNVIFLIVAPHLDALAPAIKSLVDDGFLLSQINVLSCPNAKSAELIYDCSGQETKILWRKSGHEVLGGHKLEHAVNIGQLMHGLIHAQPKPSEAPRR